MPAEQRLLAARAIARKTPMSAAVFALALQALDAKGSAPERLAATELLSHARLSSVQLRQLLAVLGPGSALGPDPLLPALLRAGTEGTRDLLAEFFLAHLKAGWSPGRPVLQQIMAILPDGAPLRKSLLETWTANNAAMLQRLEELKPLLTRGIRTADANTLPPPPARAATALADGAA